MAVKVSKRIVQAREAGAFLTSGLIFLATLLPLPLHADETDDSLHQRTRFLEAKQALEQGDDARFTHSASGLKDYPLYPYLVYWQLLNKLDEQSPVTVRAFLDNYSDTPLAASLRHAWLQHLAKEERWGEFLDFYHGSHSAELNCHFHTAQLNSGQQAAAWAGAKELWLVGHSQPEACDVLFSAWEEAGGLTPALRWQRIEMAMAKGNTGLARYLAKDLKEQEQHQVTLWSNVYAQPQLITESKMLKRDGERSRTIALQGIQRLASKQPDKAATLWPEITLRYHFTPGQRDRAARDIAMNLAFDGDVRALEWFASLPDEQLGKTSRAWAVRAALRHQRWRAAIAWIESMPDREKESDDWAYWLGRGYEALGEDAKAEAYYRKVSASRSYYGFLAADRIGTDYNLTHEALNVSEEALEGLENKPALVRASELYHLTLTKEARREWDYAVSQMNREERLAAGKLADKWKWYDRALLTLARADYFDDLTIRFPLAYSETVSSEAEKRSLDPAWVYAVARQESAMAPDAQSPVGALGLMQLMPDTGRSIARKLDAELGQLTELLQPETNIRFGSYYLREVLEEFSDNPVLATAAYNAGPHRVRQWFPHQQNLDADIWVDTMPFYETRQYVRRVMAYSVFYDQRLDRPIKRLSQRMPPVSNRQDIRRCHDCPPETDDQS